MDNTIIAIVSSSVIILGAIVFLVNKIQAIVKFNKDIVIGEFTLLSNKMDELENENSELREQSSRAIIEVLDTNTKSLDSKIALSNKGLISNVDKNKSAIYDELVLLSNKIDELENENNKLREQSSQKIIDILQAIDYKIKLSNKNILDKSEQTKLAILDKLSTAYDNLVSNINTVKQDTQEFAVNFEKYQINNGNQLENSFQNTVRLVNNLRLDNLINVSNEIGKYKNGIVEDDYFLQEVGSCKVIKFTDKQSNEVTKVYYNESGEKSNTQTFLDDKLKYEMKYTDGKLSNGVEYNEQGQVIFAYEYDEAGEVSSKIEYEYDKSGKQLEKSKVEY